MPGEEEYDYTVTITMSQQTVDYLERDGYLLYGFKAGNGSPWVGSKPLVWFSTDKYALTTTIGWDQKYQAYTSQDEIVVDGKITTSNSYDITLGQRLDVTGKSGDGEVKDDPELKGKIGISNTTTNEFTCGIAQRNNRTSNFNPIAAFDLLGGNLDTFAPVEKVLLLFALNPVDTGTVKEQSFAPALLIDISGVSEREVEYDINNGWSCGGNTWCTPYKAEDDIQFLAMS
ncbi:hypothetical protein ACFVUY_21655 [Kitasatospora sp. NPDC058063]|uniref:hypothetical protein n=1 Tax=unclassified Kitasatospora TaxID=2633591 RepID=UPI0036D8148A